MCRMTQGGDHPQPKGLIPVKKQLVKIATIALIAVPVGLPATLSLIQRAGAAPSQAAAAGCPGGSSYHSGGSYTQDKGHLTPIRIKGSNDCYDGISVKGTFPTSERWWQMKQCCNGAAITTTRGWTASGSGTRRR
jgi:hypothetical protein